MENQIVIFELGSDYFGVDTANIEGIIKMQPITQLPHTPGFVEGVTKLRGRVLPVIDLSKRFGLATKATDRNSRIIVVSLDQTEVGMIVDGVSEVLTISERALEAAPAITNIMDSSFITGIAKLNKRLVMLLDLNHLLTNYERASLQRL